MGEKGWLEKKYGCRRKEERGKENRWREKWEKKAGCYMGDGGRSDCIEPAFACARDQTAS
jgi:hypothetical protein